MPPGTWLFPPKPELPKRAAGVRFIVENDARLPFVIPWPPNPSPKDRWVTVAWVVLRLPATAPNCVRLGFVANVCRVRVEVWIDLSV